MIFDREMHDWVTGAINSANYSWNNSVRMYYVKEFEKLRAEKPFMKCPKCGNQSFVQSSRVEPPIEVCEACGTEAPEQPLNPSQPKPQPSTGRQIIAQG